MNYITLVTFASFFFINEEEFTLFTTECMQHADLIGLLMGLLKTMGFYVGSWTRENWPLVVQFQSNFIFLASWFTDCNHIHLLSASFGS